MPHLPPFTEEDLLLSESFHNWVKGDNAADVQYWEEWIAKNPEKKQLVQQAKNTILSLSAPLPDVPEQEVQQAWMQLQQTIQQRKQSGISGQSRVVKFFNWWFAVAALFVGICISVFIGWQLFNADVQIEYATDFGETKAIVLPDGSQVTLNGNTRLSHRKDWQGQENREVWLSGEAYFYVVKNGKAGHLKFVVHTDKLNVEVLGTQFNISDRKETTQVVLNEGEVKINPVAKTVAAPLIMKPGELLEYTGSKQAIIKKVTNPGMYSSWKFKMMVFEETSIQEIAQRIEATYGLRVIFADKALARRKLTGTIPSDNVDVLLLTLSRLFHLDMQKQGNQILIKAAM